MSNSLSASKNAIANLPSAPKDATSNSLLNPQNIRPNLSLIDQLLAFFQNQKILILGFGREGISTYHFLRTHFPTQKLFIADQNLKLAEQNPELSSDPHLELILGDHYLEHLADYDLIMKTPGISFAGMDTQSFRDKITSQLELLLRFSSSLTIGITGTKGKSTTSSLIYEILHDQNRPALLLGNIGRPVFESLPDITPETILVLEMSSHQLEFMCHSPHIAVITNLYPEHLDHYNSFSEYATAKAQIYLHQTPSDYFFYDFDSQKLVDLIASLPAPQSQIIPASLRDSSQPLSLRGQTIFLGDQPLYSLDSPRHLIGEYNIYNIMFALGIARLLNLDLEKATTSISNFQPLAHRLELVAEVAGVKYYDNSIATIPEATISALQALGDSVETLIIGGMDRGLDYTDFIKYLQSSSLKHIICMPKTGHDITEFLPPERRVIVETLDEAVTAAKKLTSPGSICLLSPAAASYGFFKNFEEKGDLFKKLVLK